MSQNLLPARAVAPGRILSRELAARGWTQKDLAEIMGRPPQTINEIIRGTKQITPVTALELAAALGTSAEFWTNLESNYRLHIARKKKDEQEIVRRSRLYSLAPIPELIKRGWIEATESIDELEREICNFLEVSSPDELPKLAVFRQTQEREPEANAQVAWMKRVEHLAKAQAVAKFERAKPSEAIPEILTHALRAEDVAQIPSLLLSLGIHFVIVPHLSKTYLDGAAFYLKGNPVVALTLRHDRIDAFWFALKHELGHIVLGHQGVYLDNFDDRNLSAEENEANQLLSCDWLLNPKAFAAFVADTRPYFSKAAVEKFAKSQGRHTGIVVGRLQHEELISYQHFRSLLVKVSPLLKDWIDISAPQ